MLSKDLFESIHNKTHTSQPHKNAPENITKNQEDLSKNIENDITTQSLGNTNSSSNSTMGDDFKPKPLDDVLPFLLGK